MSSDATATDPPAADPRKGARKKRWWLRIVLTLGVLLLVIAGGVQIVLWTDLPRGIVVRQIEGQLGLRLTVKSLTTGWLGNTELHDVTVGLPLSDKAFLDVPVMRVKNTSLFGLIIGRPVEVRRIELENPHLYVQQDSAGQWNLQQVAQLLARAGGQKSGEESAATSSSPAMPDVHLAGGVISIIDNQKRAVDISPLSVEGYSETGVSWKYDAQIPSKLNVTGRLVPGGTWAHEVAVQLQDIADWAKPWNPAFPKIAVDVNWRGELSPAGIGGRLDVQKAVVEMDSRKSEAHGVVAISAGSTGVSFRPDKLLLSTGINAVPPITLVSGAVSFDPSANLAKADQLLVSVFGGAVKVTADYNLANTAANLEVAWDHLAAKNDIIHSGGLKLALRKPFPDRINIDGHLTSVGNRGPGQWLVSANFSATGRAFNDFNWTINADKVQWQRHVQNIILDGLTLGGALRSDSVTLTSISLPNKDQISGTAGYSFVGKQAWEAHVKGSRWPYNPIPGTELSFSLNARGDTGGIALEDFTITGPDAQVSINGNYTFGKPPPLKLNLSIRNGPPRQGAVATAVDARQRTFSGIINGNFSVEGTVMPPVLTIAGELDGREVDIRGHHVGEIRLKVAKQSHIDSTGVFVYTDALTLLGGQWEIDGIYVPDWNDLTLNVEMKSVSLHDLATLADQQNVSGTIDGRVHVSVPGLDFSPANIVVPPASFTLKDVDINAAKIDRLDGALWMQHGHFEMNPVHFTHAEGTGDVRVAMDLNNFRRIDVNTKISNWPIDIEGAEAHMNASIDIPDALIELPNARASDPAAQNLRVTANEIDFAGSTTLKGKQLGTLVAHAGMDGRDIDVRAVHMKMLGGRLDGQAHANLDAPLNSTAEFTWQDVGLKELAAIFPALDETSGSLTGNVRIAPTTVPRPREPLAIVVTTQFKDGFWRTLPIQDLRIATYIGPNNSNLAGGWRVIMEDNKLDPSFIHVGGGTIEPWARAEFGGRATSSQAQLSFKQLDLNQFVHAIEPTAAQMPGRVAGSIMLIRAPIPGQPTTMPMERMFPGRVAPVITPLAVAGPHEPPLKKLIDPIYGEGHIELTRTNLANFGPFAFLYNLGTLFKNVNKPEGFGNVEFHLERGAVSIDEMHYFNRGTEIRAVGTAKNIWDGSDATLESTITLVEQPLKSVKLPFITDLNEAFTAIQRGLHLSAVRTTGPLKKLKITQLGLSELGAQMRTLLVRDAKAQ